MKSSFVLLLLCVVSGAIGLTAADADDKWICYQTVCERGVHFCNHALYEKRCSRCEDFSHRCFSDKHEPNCTAFCSDFKEIQIKGRDCASAPDIPNGSNNGSNASYPQETLVTYLCKDGFAIKGHDSIQCREFGQWPIPPICEEIRCQVDESTEHGRIVIGTSNEMENSDLSDGYTRDVGNAKRNGKTYLRFGETVKIVCDEGFRLRGSDSLTCTQRSYLRVPSCMLIDLDCQCEVWKILFGGSIGLHGFMIVGVLVYCWQRKPWKSFEYGPIKKRDDFESGMPSIPDKDTNDSGVHTPLSAQSSAASLETTDKDETMRMKNDDMTRQRQGEERVTAAITNSNQITININALSNGESAVKDSPGAVTTVCMEEIGEKNKVPSPNTERKELDDQNICPRPELDSNDVHQPSDDDSGEKAIGYLPTGSPSAAEPSSSATQTQHAQEQDQGNRAKVMLDSGEADMQDLGS